MDLLRFAMTARFVDMYAWSGSVISTSFVVILITLNPRMFSDGSAFFRVEINPAKDFCAVLSNVTSAAHLAL